MVQTIHIYGMRIPQIHANDNETGPAQCAHAPRSTPPVWSTKRARVSVVNLLLPPSPLRPKHVPSRARDAIS